MAFSPDSKKRLSYIKCSAVAWELSQGGMDVWVTNKFSVPS